MRFPFFTGRLAALALLIVVGRASAQNLTQSGFTGQLVPQYLAAGNTAPASRLPVVYRASITAAAGLAANTTYRYFTQCATTADLGGTNPGAGNSLYVGSPYVFTTGPGLTAAGSYGTFTTDGSGTYSGWFGFVPTASARFTVGTDVLPTIVIGTTGGVVQKRLALNQTIRVLAITAAAGASNATFLRGASGASAQQMVVLYDNGTSTSAPTNRPLSVAVVESSGATIGSTPTGYTTTTGAWNTLIPNTNANGVRYLEQRSLANVVVGCAEDADGTWGSGVVTASPTSGLTPLDLTAQDAPLTSCSTTPNPAPTVASLAPGTAAAGSGGFTLTVNGSGFFSNSVVQWNGDNRPTTFVSSSQLTATISAADVAATATVPVRVFNAAPGGGTSGVSNFSVTAPVTSGVAASGTPLGAFNGTVGGASAGQSFSVLGTALTGNVTVTATAGYEVSLAAGTGYAAAVVVAQAAADPGPATVWVRFVPTVAGPTGGTIALASPGAPGATFGVTGFALAAEPTVKPTVTFGTLTPTTAVVNFSGGNGQKRLVVARQASATSYVPIDGTTYAPVAAFGTSTGYGGSSDQFVVYAGTGSTVTVTGLTEATTYYFSVFEYNDGSVAGAENYLTTAPVGSGSTTTPLGPPSTYTWNVAAGPWTAPASWSPARTTARVNDILIFDGSVRPTATVTLDFTPTGTANPPATAGIQVGQLKFVNGVQAILTTDAKRQLNLNGDVAGTDLVVDGSSRLTLRNTVAQTGLYLYLPADETGSVLGTITIDGTVTTASGATSKLLATNTGSGLPTDGGLVFGSGSMFVAGRNASGNLFGDQAAFQNGIVFESGATYRHLGASQPFGLNQPASVVFFAPGSTYRFEQWSAAPQGSGRTYGSLVFDIDLTGAPGGSTATPSLTGSSLLTIAGDLRVLNATSVSIATSPLLLKGAVEINAPTTISAAALTFDGSGPQALSGSQTLTLTGATTTVNSPLAATGGTVSFGAAGPQTLTGSGSAAFYNLTNGAGTLTLGLPTSIGHILKLNAGNVAAGGHLTLRSDATATAMVWNAGAGAVTGATTVQRYADPSLNAGRGYRHFASPVAGSTFDDLTTTGFTPFANAAYNPIPAPTLPLAQFPNVFGYDETRGGSANTAFLTGYYSPTATTDALTTGRGYAVYFPGGATPAFVGTLNNGSVAINGLTRTGAALGSTQKSGWQLLGNPYPSPIDWDLVTIPAGMSAAVSVWRSTGPGNAGQYVTYTNGIGPAGADLIGLGQGFFARVTGAGPVNLTLTNAARVTTYANPALHRASNSPAFGGARGEDRPVVGLRLAAAGAPAAQADEAFVYFETGATAAVDDRFDGEKPMRNVGLPTLASLTAGGAELAINGLAVADLAFGTRVPLLLDLPTAGTYTLETSRLLNLSGYSVLLVDALTGTAQDLQQQGTYTFQSTTAGEMRNRFTLEFGQRITGTSPLEPITPDLHIWPNPSNGQFRVALPADLTIHHAFLIDALGRIVARPVLASGTSELDLRTLPTGIYLLRLLTDAGTLKRRVVIE